MKAVTPIFPSSAACEVVYAKNQPEYEPLPAFRTQTCVVTRWKLSDDERRHIAGGGDLFICMMNFGRPILPILPMAADPETVLQTTLEAAEDLYRKS
jgi:hypothetical protein